MTSSDASAVAAGERPPDDPASSEGRREGHGHDHEHDHGQARGAAATEKPAASASAATAATDAEQPRADEPTASPSAPEPTAASSATQSRTAPQPGSDIPPHLPGHESQPDPKRASSSEPVPLDREAHPQTAHSHQPGDDSRRPTSQSQAQTEPQTPIESQTQTQPEPRPRTAPEPTTPAMHSAGSSLTLTHPVPPGPAHQDGQQDAYPFINHPEITQDKLYTFLNHWVPQQPPGNIDYAAGFRALIGKLDPPSTVTPSQMHVDSVADLATTDHSATPTNRPKDKRRSLASFARIKFADSVYQMNTYSVIIGRDTAAINQAQRDQKLTDAHRVKVQENERLGLPPPPPLGQNHKYSKSYISEEGGILGPELSSTYDDGGPPAKRIKTTSSSETSGHAQEDPAERPNASERQYVSHTPGAAAVDWESLVPDPDQEPIVAIHSPGPDIIKNSKGISRRHLRIAYNKSKGVFEATALHHNGFFHQEVHYGLQSKVVVRSGDLFQVKDIAFHFLINGVELGCTGAEDTKEKKTGGAKEISFDFEQAHGNGHAQDTSDDELSDIEEADIADVDLSMATPERSLSLPGGGRAAGDTKMVDTPDPDKVDGAAGMPGPLSQLAPDASGMAMPEVPRKRGPGRPPKNGIMSKRQQRELKKAQQEMARKQAAEEPPVEPPAKRKVGRPRKHPLPEGELAEKRKYKPRKKGEDEEGSDAERLNRERKSKAARPKSPPLELRKEDYTEEQLQKPNKNYGVLIDEALSEIPDGLTLKQIYKRIALKYPWFYFHTETKGWESSVRHNLIGNEAFSKIALTGKWIRVPGVELDAGKRRKASSPDRSLMAQGYGAGAYQYGNGQQPQLQHQLPQQQQHMVHAVPGQQQQQQQQQHPPMYPAGQQPGFQMPGYNLQQPPHPQPQAVQPKQQQPPSHFAPSASPPNLAAPAAVGGTPQAKSYGQHQQQHHHHQQQQQVPAAARPVASSPYNHPPPYTQQPRASPSTAAGNGTGTQAPGQPGSAAAPPAPQATATSATPGQIGAAGSSGARMSQGPQPSSQGQAQTPSTPQPSAATPASPAQQLIEPALLNRLNNLRLSLANGLKKASTPDGQDLVWSAVDRIVGLKKDPSGLNNNLEATCYNGMMNLVQRANAQQSMTPEAGGGGAGASNAMLLPPGVSRHIEALRNQCVGAIKQKIPENDAICLVHSAILRTLGLATESRLGSRAGSFEGLEKAVMLNVGQALSQMPGQPRERQQS